MNALKKFGVYVLIVVVAVLVAGLYGIAHNQISYTVAPEYFTKFKFRQFGLVDTPLPERVRLSSKKSQNAQALDSFRTARPLPTRISPRPWWPA